MWRWKLLIYHPNLLCFRGIRGQKRGSKWVKTCPSPYKTRYKCYLLAICHIRGKEPPPPPPWQKGLRSWLRNIFGTQEFWEFLFWDVFTKRWSPPNCFLLHNNRIDCTSNTFKKYDILSNEDNIDIRFSLKVDDSK